MNGCEYAHVAGPLAAPPTAARRVTAALARRDLLPGCSPVCPSTTTTLTRRQPRGDERNPVLDWSTAIARISTV